MSSDDEAIKTMQDANPDWKIWKSRSAAGEVPHYYASRPGETRDGKTLNDLLAQLAPEEGG